MTARWVMFTAGVGALCAACSDPAPPAATKTSAGPSAPAPTAAPSGSTATNAATTAAPGASGTAAPAEEPKSLCTKVKEKVWADGVNRLTGLTTKRMKDGRLAIGLAKGYTPHVLSIGDDGEGKLIKVKPKEGTELAKKIAPGEGKRMILRVTPYAVEGDAAKAYVDYRDEYEDKRRFIACGPADGSDAWLSFSGVPLLDRDPPPTDEERAKLVAEGAHGVYHELRECRTFIDIKKDDTYIVGSELLVLDDGDGKVKYSASLVVDAAKGQHERHLLDMPLKGDPPKTVVEFESPTTHGVKDGSYLLMSRYGGSFKVAFLNADKTLQGKWQSYPGYANIAEANRDDEGMTMLVTAVSMGKGFELRGARIGPKNELPKELVKIDTGEADAGQATDPMFLRDSKQRRWLSYTQGDRKKGKARLKLLPVDESFKALGPPFTVNEDAGAAEPRLVAVEDGDILVVYLRDQPTGAAELVGETLRCTYPGG
jgi:hypothetical protein